MRILIIVLLLLLSSCGYNKSEDTEQITPNKPPKETKVYVKDLLNG